jgi:diaminopimelate decarboxylase
MSSYFIDKSGELHCEAVPVSQLAADFGTPLYVYSINAVRDVLKGYQEAFKAFDPIVAYAVKANPSLAILRDLAALGGGADIVSGGELDRAIRAGVPPDRIVFAGVGKSRDEMLAGLQAGILIFNVESIPELKLLDEVACAAGCVAPIAIRVNPDVDPRTHAYISTGKKESKFGLDIKAAMEAYKLAIELKGVNPIGIHCHIGSQITKLEPFVKAAEKVARVVKEIRALGIDLKILDIGGGLGIDYNRDVPPTPAEMGAAIGPFVAASGCRLILEPGRSMVGPAGVLLTRVHYVKETPIHRYVIVDAAMNDLMRPALYDAFHPVRHARAVAGRAETTCEIVGPVCETGDFLAKGRVLPLPAAGDLMVIGSAGAYGMAMASNYNLRLRPAEVIVDGSRVKLSRRRETYDDLIRAEVEIDT